MTMLVEVDPDSPVPAYEQLRAQIAAMIATGVLVTGQQLPSIRQLAGDLGIAPGTVGRAYKELEHASLVGGRGRGGTRVLEPPRTADPADELMSAVRRFTIRARQLGVDVDDATRLVRRAMEGGLPTADG